MSSGWRAFIFLLVLGVLLAPTSTRANIPVIDGSNLAQNIVSAVEEVDQTTKQILQYKNQLLQYEEIVRNGLAPAVYTWDRVVSIQRNLKTIASTLQNYRHWARDLDDYLSKFADLDYYRSARCYGSNLSCPESEWARIWRESQEMHGFGSEARKRTLDQLMRSLESSEDELRAESANLEKLQRQTETARGQMEAIQTTNQLLSAAVQELMQIRTIMVAQYRAVAVQALYEQSKEAQQRAADERFMRPQAKTSPKVQWETWPKGAVWE